MLSPDVYTVPGNSLSACFKAGLLREVYTQKLITREQFDQLLLLQRGR